MRTADQERLRAEADRLYEQYGKPLEAQHHGQYVAIMPDGRTVIGSTVNQVLQQSVAAFGPGGFLFKIGPRAVYRFRNGPRKLVAFD